MQMSAGKKPNDDEPTAAFVIPEGLLRRARGEDVPPDTERQPGSKGHAADDIPTAPTARPRDPRAVVRPLSFAPEARGLVDPPRLRRASSRPAEPELPELEPLTERALEEDTLVNMNRDELLRRGNR